MRLHWLFPALPDRHVPGAQRRRPPNKRSNSHRKILQSAVRQIRAEYAALPRCPNGVVRPGLFKALVAKWGITEGYFRKLASGELRDDERETERA